MNNQKGVIHLLPFILIVGIIIGAAFFLFKGNFKIPKIPFLQTSQEPKVSVKEEYQNPFKKETQYVNPFDDFKSPFLSLEK